MCNMRARVTPWLALCDADSKQREYLPVINCFQARAAVVYLAAIAGPRILAKPEAVVQKRYKSWMLTGRSADTVNSTS